jgi:prolyl oligopeptidase PreP (S9A serine peptidase family)
LKIGTRGDIDPARYVVSDLRAKAADGVMVPLSLVQPKDAKGTQIAIVEAYGSYGISELADFSARRAAAMRQGITYGVCHARGGGELGEAWRLWRTPDRQRDHGEGQALHHRRLRRRHHDGTCADRAPGSVRRRA